MNIHTKHHGRREWLPISLDELTVEVPAVDCRCVNPRRLHATAIVCINIKMPEKVNLSSAFCLF